MTTVTMGTTTQSPNDYTGTCPVLTYVDLNSNVMGDYGTQRLGTVLVTVRQAIPSVRQAIPSVRQATLVGLVRRRGLKVRGV